VSLFIPPRRKDLAMVSSLRHGVLSAVLLAALGSAHAQSASGSFDCITLNSTGSCSQGESSLSWVWDGSSMFTIFNAAGGGHVSEVYFDLDVGTSASFNLAASSSGVLFSPGANPPSLPGGNTVAFSSDAAFDSPNGNSGGINGGEWAAFTVTGTSGAMDFLSGLHVRSLFNGQSESFVTVTTPVPEPGTYALMLAGLGVIGFVMRRRRPD
jgi:PEP-CTERM motif